MHNVITLTVTDPKLQNHKKGDIIIHHHLTAECHCDALSVLLSVGF